VAYLFREPLKNRLVIFIYLYQFMGGLGGGDQVDQAWLNLLLLAILSRFCVLFVGF